MLTKTDLREFPEARPAAGQQVAWYSKAETWRAVAEALYFPIVAAAAYVLVWSLARGEFSVFLQALSNVR